MSLVFKKIGELDEFCKTVTYKELPFGVDGPLQDHSVQYRGSQAPCTELLDEGRTIRIYFSARDDEKRSFPFYFDVYATNPVIKMETGASEPLLYPGNLGEFDSDGVMVSHVYNKYTQKEMLYTGWNKGNNQVRYRTACGSASFDKGCWAKKGIYLDRTINSPCGTSMPFIFKDWKTSTSTIFLMSYKKWEKSEPFYGLSFYPMDCFTDKEDLSLIDLDENTGGLARPSIFSLDRQNYLICCSRGKWNYRSDKKEGYKPRLFQLDPSFNLTEIEIKIEGSEDSLVCAYPWVERTKYGTYMFYNENSFTGPLSVAKLIT